MPRPLAALLALTLAGPAWTSAIDLADTRLVADPATSGSLVAFAYANDVWVAASDGSGVRRLTSHPGAESGPRFSPDGRLVAFTGRYEGNTDVYVVAAAGGVPRRLTYHPGNDTALGFTPDGKSVLFSSPREVYTGRYTQLFTVPVEGGFPTKLKIPNASKAAISPDGRTIAYVPLGEPFAQWKHYRGGQVSRILLFDNASYSVEQVPQPSGRCNDTDPMWIGDRLYFRSDRDGEFNLYAFDRATKAVTRLTSSTGFPVLYATAGGGRIVYEQAGYLHLLDPATGASQRLKLGVAADLVELRPRWAKGAKWIRSASLSPSGARVAFEFRGEIVTRAAREGRRPQPHADARRPRALAGLVARRQVDRVLLGRGRRVRPRARGAGRQGRAAADRAQGRRLLRAAQVVARLEEAELRRQLARALRGRRRERQADARLERAALRPGRRAAPLLVARLALARLHPQHGDLLQPALPLLARRGPLVPGERRARRRHEPGVRRLRQVPLLPGVDRRRAGATTGSRRRAPTCARRSASTWPCSRRACPRRS